jgi:hypothetical protein
MKVCPYCGHANYDFAHICRKCETSLVGAPGTVYRTTRKYLIGPERARSLRHRALSLIVLGLLMMVYWGGRGPWPTIDHPTLLAIRAWLEPLLLLGGAALYLLGWILRSV